MSGPRLRNIRFGPGHGATPFQVVEAPGAPPQPFEWLLEGGVEHRAAVAYPIEATHDEVSLRVTFDLSNSATPSRFVVGAAARSGSALGTIRDSTLDFMAGETQRTVELRADARPLAVGGVRVARVRWKWWWRAVGGPPNAMGSTDHDVYVVLDEPAPPWGRPGSGRVALWREILDLACAWSDAKDTPEKCVRAIAKSLYLLGGQVIHDRPGESRTIRFHPGAPIFALGPSGFAHGNFMNMVNLRPGALARPNCTDCAAAVSILASAVGCAMHVAKAKYATAGARLLTKPAQMLGHRSPARHSFEYHCVARRSTPGAQVSDATMFVDADADPECPPHLLRMPVELPFTDQATSTSYCGRVLKRGLPAPPIVPYADTGVLYPHGVPGAPEDFRIDSFIRLRRRRLLRLMSGVVRSEPIAGADPAGFVVRRLEQDAPVRTGSLLQVGPRVYQFQTVYHHIPHAGLLTVSLLAAKSRIHALSAFLQVAASFAAPIQPVDEVDEFAFYCPDTESILMIRDRLVLTMTSEAPAIPVIPLAVGLDKALQDQYVRR